MTKHKTFWGALLTISVALLLLFPALIVPGNARADGLDRPPQQTTATPEPDDGGDPPERAFPGTGSADTDSDESGDPPERAFPGTTSTDAESDESGDPPERAFPGTSTEDTADDTASAEETQAVAQVTDSSPDQGSEEAAEPSTLFDTINGPTGVAAYAVLVLVVGVLLGVGVLTQARRMED